VRFVEDHGFGAGQQLAEALVLQGEVGEQQVVVDHHDVRGLRFAARGDDVAARVRGAGRAEAVLARRSDRRAGRVRIAQRFHLRQVAGRRFPRPSADAGDRAFRRRLEARQLRHGFREFQAMQAQVVGAALEERDARGPAERVRHRRQVPVEQLVLERARAGRDDRLLAGEQRRHQVGEGLAGARPGLDREHAPGFERFADPICHELLLAARLEALDDARERAVRAEQPAEFAGGRHEPRARAM